MKQKEDLLKESKIKLATMESVKTQIDTLMKVSYSKQTEQGEREPHLPLLFSDYITSRHHLTLQISPPRVPSARPFPPIQPKRMKIDKTTPLSDCHRCPEEGRRARPASLNRRSRLYSGSQLSIKRRYSWRLIPLVRPTQSHACMHTCRHVTSQ